MKWSDYQSFEDFCSREHLSPEEGLALLVKGIDDLSDQIQTARLALFKNNR